MKGNPPFDPYHRWLGIPPQDQPADHYRLLGINRFEDDVEVIRDAASQRMGHVRSYQLGQYMELSQKILNELAVAKACLLDPVGKQQYDLELRQAKHAPPSVPRVAMPQVRSMSRTKFFLAVGAVGIATLLLLVGYVGLISVKPPIRTIAEQGRSRNDSSAAIAETVGGTNRFALPETPHETIEKAQTSRQSPSTATVPSAVNPKPIAPPPPDNLEPAAPLPVVNPKPVAPPTADDSKPVEPLPVIDPKPVVPPSAISPKAGTPPPALSTKPVLPPTPAPAATLPPAKPGEPIKPVPPKPLSQSTTEAGAEAAARPQTAAKAEVHPSPSEQRIPAGWVRIVNRETGLHLCAAKRVLQEADVIQVRERRPEDGKRRTGAWQIEPAPAHPTTYSRIRNEYSDLCLAIKNRSSERNAKACQTPDGGGRAGTLWKVESVGNGFWIIINRYSGQVLEVPGDAVGATARQSPRRDGAKLQEWRFEAAGDP